MLLGLLLGLNGGHMAQFADQTVQITAISDDFVDVQIGAEGFQVAKGDWDAVQSGTVSTEQLWRNAAMSCNVEGIPVDNRASVIAHVNGKTFKG